MKEEIKIIYATLYMFENGAWVCSEDNKESLFVGGQRISGKEFQEIINKECQHEKRSI